MEVALERFSFDEVLCVQELEEDTPVFEVLSEEVVAVAVVAVAAAAAAVAEH